MKISPWKINFNATLSDYEEIITWTEFPAHTHSVINNCLKNNTLVVAYHENEIIGYIAFNYDTVSIFISMAETHPKFFRKGVAKFIVEKLVKKHKNSEFKALYLYCSPQETKYIWKKIGFNYLPAGAKEDNKVYMSLEFGEISTVEFWNEANESIKNKIEIWDNECPKDYEKPKWVSKIEKHDSGNYLVRPFFFFGNEKWQIKITVDGSSKFYRYKDYDRKSNVYECFYIDKLK
ncbi:GNAT family N-acetyltransferase [Sphingobacterium sp. ML3W]|uniref:GNAT family N-acetyltransferase n=1 Tax=Sphingobacterium sp. ML3W TaxID=1538644 RepID=UPI00249BB038|nr:GNAT family N-acetyltransferase [Sphingobacterium sp. ML3W]WFA80381.1 GNAT family N-acetyltransferase [Sphingobacterium sp. ML3W]